MGVPDSVGGTPGVVEEEAGSGVGAVLNTSQDPELPPDGAVTVPPGGRGASPAFAGVVLRALDLGRRSSGRSSVESYLVGGVPHVRPPTPLALVSRKEVHLEVVQQAVKVDRLIILIPSKTLPLA